MVILLLSIVEVMYINKQDLNGVRTAQDIERKYDLKAIAGLKKNTEIQLQGLTKVENELYSFIFETISNLSNLQDEIDGKVITWYFYGIPTLLNYPASDWNTDKLKEQHLNDLYYDRETGYCYIFNKDVEEYKWSEITNKDTIEALALANAAQDTADSKRRIFIQQPIPPYDNGDLWINDNEIYICQISKKEGQEYQEQDFINNLKYTDDTLAEAVVDELGGTKTTVLNGQVVIITESFAKFTDLADPDSSTEIAGENITTGNIKSKNYVENTSGTKINLENGTIDTKNFKVDEEGNINLYNGARIIGENGLMTTYIQEAKPREVGNTVNIIGYYSDYSSYSDMKQKLYINILIPDGFEIVRARIVGYHTPVRWTGGDISTTWGYVRNLKIYNATNINNALLSQNIDSAFLFSDSFSYKEVTEGFGSSGWTAKKPSDSSHTTEKFESGDIKNIFRSNERTVAGLYQIMIESSDTFNKSWTKAQKAERTAYCPSVMLIIEGYMTYK